MEENTTEKQLNTTEYKNEIIKLLCQVSDMKVIKIIHKYLINAYIRETAKH